MKHDREWWAERLELITSFVENDDHILYNGGLSLTLPSFGDDIENYDFEPKPTVMFVNVYSNCTSVAHETINEAREFLNDNGKTIKLIQDMGWTDHES